MRVMAWIGSGSPLGVLEGADRGRFVSARGVRKGAERARLARFFWLRFGSILVDGGASGASWAAGREKSFTAEDAEVAEGLD